MPTHNEPSCHSRSFRIEKWIAFAPALDLPPYKANSDRLLELTNADTQFFGAHGIPCFGGDWVSLMSSEFGKIVRGQPEYRYVAHYLTPGMSVRLHQNGDMYIYTTPLVDPSLFWSKWMLVVVPVFGAWRCTYFIALPGCSSSRLEADCDAAIRSQVLLHMVCLDTQKISLL